jgi:hypothetical protein
MLTSALADYRSKHLHKGSSRGDSEDFATTPHEAAALLVAGDLPHATTSPGGTTECTKTSKKFNNRKSVFSIQSEGKTVNFRHNGT